MGIQASGKGTHGVALAREFGVPRIEIGQIVRDRALIDDDTGRHMAEQLRAGRLVDEFFVVQALAVRLAQEPDTGFVLDGFPRRGSQAQALDSMLMRLNVELDAAVHLMLDGDTARRRIMDRLVCTKCRRVSRRSVAPAGSVCAEGGCEGVLGFRDDDRDPASVDQRLSEFRAQTVPVIEGYRSAGRLIEVDASRGEEIVYAELRERLRTISG
jgi:adenylate kinase